jgi:hypothetical protein
MGELNRSIGAVHQIWMGDRANDAKAAAYSADDLMIVERDIGRLAKYTFDMGGTGDLLLLSLNVPPWEDLHELSREELRLTNLVTTDMIAHSLLPAASNVAADRQSMASRPVETGARKLVWLASRNRGRPVEVRDPEPIAAGVQLLQPSRRTNGLRMPFSWID